MLIEHTFETYTRRHADADVQTQTCRHADADADTHCLTGDQTYGCSTERFPTVTRHIDVHTLTAGLVRTTLIVTGASTQSIDTHRSQSPRKRAPFTFNRHAGVRVVIILPSCTTSQVQHPMPGASHSTSQASQKSLCHDSFLAVSKLLTTVF